MDLLQGVQDGVQQQDHEDIGLGMEGGDFKMPTLEQLVDLIGGANMSEEEKQNLLESITKAQTKPNIAPEASVVEQLLVLVIPLTILIIVFGENLQYVTIFQSNFVAF